MKTTLDDLHRSVNLLDIEFEWDACVHYKTVRLYHDNSYKSLTGQDKTRARFKVGVYRHMAIISDEPTVLYVGMSRTSSIGNRQTSHLSSFKNPKDEHEMSGKKYREYIEKLGVESIDVTIEYVDLSHLNSALIPLFEVASIDYFIPVLNPPGAAAS